MTRTIPPAYGSPGRLARDLARYLAREGHAVTVLATAKGPQPVLRKGHLKVIRIPANQKPGGFFAQIIIFLKLLRAALKLPGHDIVITLTDPPMLLLAGRWLARSKGAKHVHWVHQLYPDLFDVLGVKQTGLIRNWMRVSSRKAMKRADALVSVSRCMARHLAHTGMETRKLHTIENWPDPELAGHDAQWLAVSLDKAKSKTPPKRPTTTPDRVWSEAAGQKFRVLYAGTIGRANPMETILGAATLLAPKHPEIEFVFVGAGPGFERIAAYRDKHGLENMRILPPQPRFKLKDMMESGDIHLMSLADSATGLTMPSKLYSALAVARPIAFIGAQDCHIAGLINKHRAGEIIPHGQPQKLASMIRNYRMDSGKWYAAHEGALEASKNRMPEVSLKAWAKLVTEL